MLEILVVLPQAALSTPLANDPEMCNNGLSANSPKHYRHTHYPCVVGVQLFLGMTAQCHIPWRYFYNTGSHISINVPIRHVQYGKSDSNPRYNKQDHKLIDLIDLLIQMIRR